MIDHKFSMYYKEDDYAMVSAHNDDCYVIETSEGNTLDAFDNYFKNLCEQIPINYRSKLKCSRVPGLLLNTSLERSTIMAFKDLRLLIQHMNKL
jgi:hypothetical protein